MVGNAASLCLGSCSAISTDATAPNNNAGVDAMINVAAHELTEALTDPFGSTWWDLATGNENADKCAWNFGAIYVTSNCKWNVQDTFGRKYLVQQNWHPYLNKCVLTA